MRKEPGAKSQEPLVKSEFVTSAFFPNAYFLMPIALKFVYCLLPFAFLLLPISAFSQEKTKRPKIGLVLSGGGAKGFAHIGVLKVLEQAGVKIDYIAGTSMGAVVGGLYASGYSATQIDSIFYNTDFDELLQDYIPRSSKSFYEKHNDQIYAISLPFNKLKIGIPIALSKGMYNYNLLSKLTHKVRHVNDFSKLPIPFSFIPARIFKVCSPSFNTGNFAGNSYTPCNLSSIYTQASAILLEEVPSAV